MPKIVQLWKGEDSEAVSQTPNPAFYTRLESRRESSCLVTPVSIWYLQFTLCPSLWVNRPL